MIRNSSIHKIVALLLGAALFLCAPWLTAFAEEPPDDALGLSGQEGAALSLGASMTVAELQALIDANQGGTVVVTGNVLGEDARDTLNTSAPVTVQLGDYGIVCLDWALTISGPIHFVGRGVERPVIEAKGVRPSGGCSFTATGDNAVAVKLQNNLLYANFSEFTAEGENSTALWFERHATISAAVVRAEKAGGVGVRSHGDARIDFCDILAGAESAVVEGSLVADGSILTPEPTGDVSINQEPIAISSVQGDRIPYSVKQVLQADWGILPQWMQARLTCGNSSLNISVPIRWEDGAVDYSTWGDYSAKAAVCLPGRLQVAGQNEFDVPVAVFDEDELYFGGVADTEPGFFTALYFFSGTHLSGETTLWYSADEGESWQEWEEEWEGMPTILRNDFNDSLYDPWVEYEDDLQPDRRSIEIVTLILNEEISYHMYLELIENGESVRSSTGVLFKTQQGDWDLIGGDRDGSGRNPGKEPPGPDGETPGPDPDPEPPDGGENPDPNPQPEPPPSGGENPDPDPPDGGEKPGPGPGTGPPDSGTPPEPELPGDSGGNGTGNNGRATPSGSSGSRTDDTRTAAADAVSPSVQMDQPITGESPPIHPIYAEPDQSNTAPLSTAGGEAPAHSFSRQDLDRLLQANPVNVDFFAGGLRLTLPHAALASVELGEDERFVVDLTMPEDNRFSLRLWAGEREIVSFADTRFAVTLPYTPADDTMEIVCTGADGDRPPAAYHGGKLTVTLVKTGEYTITQEGIQPLAAQADSPISGQASPEPETPAATSSFPWGALPAVPVIILSGAIAYRKLGRPLWKRG